MNLMLSKIVVVSALIVCSAVAAAEPQTQQILSRGGVLSGELHAMRSRDPSGKHVNTFQLVSGPHRLAGPNGLCNLETGPETFQIVTTSAAEAGELKSFVGKQISIKANEFSCAEQAGQMSDAIVSKWSLATSR